MKKLNTSLLTYIDHYSVTALIDKINEANEDVEISGNSFGGSIYAGQGFIDFLNSSKNKVNANVTGIAASMGCTLLSSFNYVKGAYQSDVMFHSMAGSPNLVDHTNEFLYKSLAKKINEVKFKKITGHELKTVMMAKGDERFNVWITGKDAEEIGLYDEGYDLLEKQNNLDELPKLNDLGYEIPKEIKEKYAKKAKDIIITTKNNNDNNDNNDTMDIQKLTKEALKEGNPTLFLEIATDERNRISKIAKFLVVDEKKAQSIIDSGKDLTVEDVVEFMEKKVALGKVADIEGLSDGDDDFVPTRNVKTQKTEKLTDKQKEAKEKTAALDEILDDSGISSDVDRIVDTK